MAAASALRSSLLLFSPSEQKSSSLLERVAASHPSAFYCSAGPPIVWGCSYLRRQIRSSVCNGTLSVGVCSLWLSGPKHVCIFDTESCFSSFRALRLACRLSESLYQA
jgi:hypothetical protein